MEQREIYLIKRRRLGLSLQQVADALNVHKATVCRWETGVLPFPEKYANYLDYYKAK